MGGCAITLWENGSAKKNTVSMERQVNETGSCRRRGCDGQVTPPPPCYRPGFAARKFVRWGFKIK